MMNTVKRVVLPVAISMLAMSTASYAVVGHSATQQVQSKQYAVGEVLVSFTDQSSSNSLYNVNLYNAILGKNQYTQKIFSNLSSALIQSDGYTTQELIAKFAALDSVESVSPNYINHLMGATNDTYYNDLWAMENTGQNGGTVDADIDAKEAWDIQSGSRDVVVAVVDTGIDYTHSDLIANMWDGSAYGLNYHGYDFTGDSLGNNDDDPMPELSHGTHVAGIIGASANNNIGVVGVAHEVSLMALKVFRSDGTALDSDILEAMNFISQKIDEGVNIVAINASYGTSGRSDVIKNAIEELGAKGVIMCAAAGNENSNNDGRPTYPASYDLDNIISVAATDRNDKLASFSNYGRITVDIAAPGAYITSSAMGNNYETHNGTSMAAPHVAGAVALLAANDLNATALERIERILSSVDSIASLTNKVSSGGRLNIHNALLGNYGGDNNNSDVNVTTWTTGAYENYEDRSQDLLITGATSLSVTISGETEAGYDFIYIYDEKGKQIAKLDGIINKTVTVKGSLITAKLTSDYSITKSGVTVSIVAVDDEVKDDVTTWTTGAYDNNEDRSQVLSIAGATNLHIKVSGETEERYDFFYIYNENGNLISVLDGRINASGTIKGSSITARLTSDYLLTKSGVTITISAQ